VTVSATKSKTGDRAFAVEENYLVEAIYVDGKNVLRPERDTSNIGNMSYWPLGASSLNDKLVEELVVPRHLLHITYTPADAGSDSTLRFPMNWTMRKG
jgi:hypothetical protein